MRLLLLLGLALLSSCTAWNRSTGQASRSTALPFGVPAPEDPVANLDPDHPAADVETNPPPSPAAPEPPRPPLPVLATRMHNLSARGVSLTVLAFDDRQFTVQVADKESGPDTSWPSAQAAARAHGAAAAINASFFTPEGTPLGLVIENGRSFGTWSTGSSLTSGLLVASKDRPALLRRESRPPSGPVDHLIQSGPLLLEKAAPVRGLSTAPRRARSFLAWDGNHGWIMGVTPAATLAELATALASQPVPGLQLVTALNLDGGRSSDLWVSPSLAGREVSTRRIWNNPVRNYVLLVQTKRSS